MSSAEYSCRLSKPIFAYRQTVWTSLIWVHTVCKNDFKSQADNKADDNSCDWRFKGSTICLRNSILCSLVSDFQQRIKNIMRKIRPAACTADNSASRV